MPCTPRHMLRAVAMRGLLGQQRRFGLVVRDKWHPHECWDTKLPSRTRLIVVYLLVASRLVHQPRTGCISKWK